MVREVVAKNSFKRDFKKAHKQGLIGENEILEIQKIVQHIANNEPLDPKYKDHALQFDYNGCRDCHIKPNLVLVYKIVENSVFLTRIGRHQDIFKGY
jgi:mRNA interferase YafQ